MEVLFNEHIHKSWSVALFLFLYCSKGLFKTLCRVVTFHALIEETSKAPKTTLLSVIRSFGVGAYFVVTSSF